MSRRKATEEGLVVPDGITPVEGWRWWKTGTSYMKGDDAIYLRSVFISRMWLPGQAVDARCGPPRRRRHDAPNPECFCGLYAVKTLEQAAEEAMIWMFRGGPHPPTLTLGTVNLWGQIEEGETGYRAQCAYPKKIVWGNQAKEMAERYRVPYESIELDYPGFVDRAIRTGRRSAGRSFLRP